MPYQLCSDALKATGRAKGMSKMYDCSKLISDFHSTHVRLTRDQQKEMRERRDTNVKRVRAGLAEKGKPEIADVISQGGYAMKTMTQPPEGSDSRYDIDLGLVFESEDAAGPRTTRCWVRDALAAKATNVKGDPEDKGKCVRIEYAAGYQCDFPVFRRWASGDSFVHQVALHDEWVTSSPQQMNTWFERQVVEKSPEAAPSYQLRRIVRLMKFLAKTWQHASSLKYPTGLLLTALTVECFEGSLGRDDKAFYRTLCRIGDRSHLLPVYADGILISREKDTIRLQRLQEKAVALADTIKDLVDRETDHDDESARKVWKKVFRHSFFDPVEVKGSTGTRKLVGAAAPTGAAAFLIGLAAEEAQARAEAAVRETQAPTKPWSPQG